MKKANRSGASSLDTHLGFWLRFVSNQVSRRFEKLLEGQGISVTEWVAMRTLYQSSGVTHAELIEALGMTTGAASKVTGRTAIGWEQRSRTGPPLDRKRESAGAQTGGTRR